ncbi:MAG TPA: ATP-binding protein [Allocoleopsis sp.]
MKVFRSLQHAPMGSAIRWLGSSFRRTKPRQVASTSTHKPAPKASPPPIPSNELERLKALHRYKILDTSPEAAFDDLTALASYICGTPIALVSLSDANRQWFKSKVGLEASEASREIAFCAHAILSPAEPLIIPNTLNDERFATNPLVVSDPNIRFYAGVPLVTPDRFPVGTLCVLDRIPRDLTSKQIEALSALGRQVITQMELRVNLARLERTVTQYQQTESALLSSAATNRALLDAIPDVMFRISQDGTFVNYKAPQNGNLFVQPREFLGKKVDEVMPPDVAQPMLRCIDQALQTGEVQVLEYQLPVQGNATYWEARLAVIDNNEVMAIWRDITKRKQAEAELFLALEKEKELNELKSRFVSMTSHEFRTPLTTILGSAELLEHYSQKWSEEKKQRHIQRIQHTVQHMTQLLNDVLLLGKAEAGKLEFNPQPLDLEQFCLNLTEEFELDASNQHDLTFVTLAQAIQGNCDEKLLRHILNNLLSNAIKYSPSGSNVKFELSCRDSQAIFRIQDEGIGIPEEDQQRLFESFHRAKNVGNVPGTGLGLAIVKNAVDLHGGKISVNSEVGIGTTFTVIIPLNQER